MFMDALGPFIIQPPYLTEKGKGYDELMNM
jgi:hypothetical protein